MNPIYLLASLAGVGLLVGLNFLLDRGRHPASDLANVPANLAGEIPGFRGGASVIAGTAALFENANDGSLYLAVLKGDGIVTRKLARGCRVSRDGRTLSLGLSDFTFPATEFPFRDEASATEWQSRLARIAN